jgi:hypothetical protein
VADDILTPVEEEKPEQVFKETPVADWPGWVKITSGNSRRYRSPGGLDISAARFMLLAQRFRGQKYIPESDIPAKPSTKPSTFFSGKTGASGSKSTHPDGTTAKSEISDDKPIDLPEARPRVGSKPQGGRASARELSDSFQTTLLIATSLVALLLKFPDLAMNEAESKGIAIPLANILEKSRLNERFGRMIANSGDYQLLGYALYLYLDRVTTALNVRRQNFAAAQHSSQPIDIASTGQPSGGLQPAAGNGFQSTGANLPYSPAGTGRVTPITRQG